MIQLSMLVAVAFALCYGLAGRRVGENEIALIRRAGIALAAIAAWMIFTGEIAARGFIAQFEQRPPPMLFVFLVVIALGVALGFSRVGDRLIRGISLPVLIGIQAFRFPLELVMHRAAVEGVMPVQMSYSGWNFDILTGITAIFVSILLAIGWMPRWGIWLWNIGGIALLAGIIILAAASSPMIRAFGDEPPRVNTWVAYFPFIWLPAVLVVAAIFGHVVITRKLLRTELASRR
jgi:hypothetical protein